MYREPHINSSVFFSIIQNRLFKYLEAIWWQIGGGANAASFMHYNLEKLKSLNEQDNFCGKGFWGYGINSICNGQQSLSYPDVEEIKKLDILNKHLKPFRNLLLLTFKIEKHSLYVSTFFIDSCEIGIVSDINRRYSLLDFDNARIQTRNNKTHIEIVIKGLLLPLSFQLDDYYIPNYLSGPSLAKYYIDKIKELADQLSNSQQVEKYETKDFIGDIVSAIRILLKQGLKVECIKKLHEENKKDEGSFRNWFQNSFEMKGYTAEAEVQKSNGRIDLKVTHISMPDKVIEFKGWWNNDKKEIVNQLHKYLTDFEGDGYILMINHTNKNIEEDYKKIVTSSEMNYVLETWKEIKIDKTAYSYFITNHDFARRKIVYHFIFSVH